MNPATLVFAVFQCVAKKCGAVRPIFETPQTRVPQHRRVYRCHKCDTRGTVQPLTNPLPLREFEIIFANMANVQKGLK